MRSEKTSIKNSKGEKISVVIHNPTESSKRPILLQHGLFSDKGGSYIWRANYFAKKGFRAIRFDRRGYGDSDLDFHEFNLTTGIGDSILVMDYLERKMGEEKFGIFGSSFGGLIAIYLSFQDKRVDSLALRSPVTYTGKLFEEIREEVAKEGGFDLDDRDGDYDYIDEGFFEELSKYEVESILDEIEAPILIFHGTEDAVVSIEDTKRFYDSLNTKKKLVEIEEGNHIFSAGEDQKVLRISADWFSKFLNK